MNEILFQAGQYTVRAIVEGSESEVSPFTGRRLRKLRIRFITNTSEPHEVLQGCLDSGVRILDKDGNQTELWGANQLQYSTSSNFPHETYIWELTEREIVKADKLQLGSVELTPYHYKEEIDDGALVVTARVMLTSDRLTELKVLPRYFEVHRQGVSENIIEMRLTSIMLWSRDTDDGPFKYEVVLIEKCYDDKHRRPGLLEPQLWNVEMSTSAGKLRLRKLIDLLQTKGLISKSEADQVWNLQDAEVRNERRNLDRVDDLDEFRRVQDED